MVSNGFHPTAPRWPLARRPRLRSSAKARSAEASSVTMVKPSTWTGASGASGAERAQFWGFEASYVLYVAIHVFWGGKGPGGGDEV